MPLGSFDMCNRRGLVCWKEIAECAASMSIPCFTEMVEGLDPSVVNALAVVGGLVLARSVFCLLGAVFKTFLRPGKNLKQYGAWAVVTGATGERACLSARLPAVAKSSSGAPRGKVFRNNSSSII